MTAARDLNDRLDAKFAGILLTALAQICCCRELWLQGGYESRGDSQPLELSWRNRSRLEVAANLFDQLYRVAADLVTLDSESELGG